MRNVHRSTLAAASLAALAVVGLSACSNDSSTSASEAATSAEMMSSAMAEPPGNLVGSGCAAYAEQVPEGPGSVAGSAGSGDGGGVERRCSRRWPGAVRQSSIRT
jgi:hypothetical protein